MNQLPEYNETDGSSRGYSGKYGLFALADRSGGDYSRREAWIRPPAPLINLNDSKNVLKVLK